MKEEYIKERLDDQIDWYNSSAIHCKKWHERLTIASILISVLATVCASFNVIVANKSNALLIINTLLPAIATSILSIDKIKRYQELHIQYRNTCEKLKQEKYLYLTESAEYSSNTNKSSLNLLVERVESICSTEVGNWAQLDEKKQAR